MNVSTQPDESTYAFDLGLRSQICFEQFWVCGKIFKIQPFQLDTFGAPPGELGFAVPETEQRRLT